MTTKHEKPATAHDAVVKMHKMVCKLAHKAIGGRKENFQDVYQWGMAGVTRAFNDFDNTKSNAKFTTVAYKYAFQFIQDNYVRKDYQYQNSTSALPIEEFNMDTFEADTEQTLQFQQILNQMPVTERIITLMRNEGHGYQTIVDALNKTVEHRDKPLTYAQVRSRHLKALQSVGL